MKKLALLAALILLAGLCFAQDAEDETTAQVKRDFFNIEITVGVPIHWTNSPSPHTKFVGDFGKDKIVTANTALGAALLFNFSEKIGLTLDTDFFFGTELGGQSPTSSNANSLFGFNGFLGPVFYLYNGSYLRVPLAVGAHLYYWSSDQWAPGLNTDGGWIQNKDLQIGPGVSLGIQFHFDRNIYILSRTNVALTLFRSHHTQVVYDTAAGYEFDEKETERTTSWHVKPSLGVGIKF